MGRLIRLGDIVDPSWYFDDAWYDPTNGGQHKYAWPNPSFPYRICIPFKCIEDNKVKIEIRRWIELHIQDTVIIDYVNKSYRVYYGNQIVSDPYDFWDASYDRSNNWVIFYFEDQHSATAFRLRFSDLVKEIFDRFPEDEGKITR